MSALAERDRRLELRLAALLEYGTWAASAVTAVGLAMALAHSAAGMRVVTAGMACFILLPVLRVSMMLVEYLRERDLRFAAISATVLVVILAGVALGVHMAKTWSR